MDLARFAASPVGRLVPLRGVDGRSGKEYDHAAFMPDPLAGEPTLSNATWRVVARAGHALGRLQQAARQIPTPALLRRPTLHREAQSTSALEGTFAPLEDVLSADLFEASTHSAELHEVLNYVATAEAAFGWLRERRHLTVSMLCELQRILVTGTAAHTDQAGNLRQIPVAIGGPGDSITAARFVPAPPGLGLESGLRDLVDWINGSAHADRDPVVAAALAHYQFESLHPFNDGNGRLGRLLIVLQLMQDGVLGEPLLSVSPWFEARRKNYQDHLAAVSADGDWDGWVAFFAEGIRASAIDTSERVDRLLDILDDYLERVRTAGAIGMARDIAESLIAYPYVTVSDAAKRMGRSNQAANNAVARLVELRILRERTGRRHGRVFEATDVVVALTGP